MTVGLKCLRDVWSKQVSTQRKPEMSSFFKVKLQLPGLAILALLQFEQSMPAIAEVVVQPGGAAQSALVEKRDAETLRKDGEALIYVPDPSLRNVTAGVDLLQQSRVPQNVGQLPSAAIDGTIGTWMRPVRLFS